MELEASLPDLDRLRARLRIPAACLATLRDGEVATLLALGAGARPEAIFEAASLTKPVFAAAVLQLAASGVLDLDRPLSAHPAGAPPVDDSAARRITARHVLSHRSGLPNWITPGAPALVAEPGSRFGYSGEAHVYLQRVVEAELGEPLASFVDRLVLAPAGMAESGLSWRPAWLPGLAPPHDAGGEPLERVERPASAAGTLFTTAADYARFLRFLLRRAPLLTTMVEPHTEVAPPVAWGLGFGLSGPLAFHWGDNPGYKHLAVLDPSAGAGLVVLTNSDAGWRLHLAAAERTVPGAAFPAWLERAYEAPGPSLHR